MTDEPQVPLPEPQPGGSVIQPGVPSPKPQKSNRNLWIASGIAVAVICLCSILCIALTATGIGKIIVEKAPIESVLDAFMKDMAAKDIESAYDHFSPRTQRQMAVTELEKMIQGNNYILFKGYESLSVQNLNLTAAVNTNPDLPQGTVANVEGTISYEGGFTGQFNAVLEKVDGLWKIYNINVTVPPDKFQP